MNYSPTFAVRWWNPFWFLMLCIWPLL
jgi:hypothetical protein